METLPANPEPEIDVQITEHFLPIFDPAHPESRKMFKAFRGGRGGMKSYQIATGYILKGYRTPRKILCTREYQKSIADSVHSLLVRRIAALSMQDFYRVLNHRIVGANGTEFVFEGLKMNINNVKSFDGTTDLWMEEAHTISRNSIDVLFPSIRESGAEFTFSYNPDLDGDPIHQYIANLPPDLLYVAETTWRDNPWLSDTLRIQKDLQLRRITEATSDDERDVEQQAYDHIWEGKTRKNSKSQIFAGKTVSQGFEAVKGGDGKWRIDGALADGPYFGLDFGFSVDPVAAVRCFIAGECLYIDHELYEHQLELDDHVPEIRKQIPDIGAATVRADVARPETISHCRKDRTDARGVTWLGLQTVGAKKWTGSVEDGITVLKSFKKIVIHPRCGNMLNEARLYSYKVDAKTGEVLTDVVDKFNHLWDALRYALAPFIKRSGKGIGFLEFYQKQHEEAQKAEENARKK